MPNKSPRKRRLKKAQAKRKSKLEKINLILDHQKKRSPR
jgi:hypothetical protein